MGSQSTRTKPVMIHCRAVRAYKLKQFHRRININNKISILSNPVLGKKICTTICFAIAMTEPNLGDLTKQSPAIINNRSNNIIRAEGVSKELNYSFSIKLNINSTQVKVC